MPTGRFGASPAPSPAPSEDPWRWLRPNDSDVVHARDLLVHRVLGRDQAAIVDLVRDVLTPLDQVRGGARVLLETLQAYFDAGEVATEAARRLHGV